ncbi:MAG: hypothetical protein ABI277_14805 [Burkholderiaceae bacterium]
MRRFVSWTAAVLLLLVFVAAAIAFGVHLIASTHGMTMTINGESVEGPVIAAAFGAAAALGAVLVCLFVIAIIASVAIVVPLVLALVAVAIVIALVVGLSPVLVPVLLLVGAYVLLSRRSRRRANGAFPSSTATS